MENLFFLAYSRYGLTTETEEGETMVFKHVWKRVETKVVISYRCSNCREILKIHDDGLEELPSRCPFCTVEMHDY